MKDAKTKFKGPWAVFLCPTRELCVQIKKETRRFATAAGLSYGVSLRVCVWACAFSACVSVILIHQYLISLSPSAPI